MGLGRGIRNCSTVALASRLFEKGCGLSLGVAPKRSSRSKISKVQYVPYVWRYWKITTLVHFGVRQDSMI